MLLSKLFDRFLPPDRRFNPEALAWVAVIFTAIVMLAVESSIAVGVHEAPVALAFIVTVIHAGSMPLSMLRPLFGAILSVIACGVLPLLGPYLSGAPWPWMVPMMITQILIILIVGLRAHWGVALAALLASIAISAAAAVFGHIQYPESGSDSSIVNIVVFSCIAGGFYVAAVIVQQWHLIRSQLLQEQENTAEEHSEACSGRGEDADCPRTSRYRRPQHVDYQHPGFECTIPPPQHRFGRGEGVRGRTSPCLHAMLSPRCADCWACCAMTMRANSLPAAEVL